jgi:hypothetical protein
VIRVICVIRGYFPRMKMQPRLLGVLLIVTLVAALTHAADGDDADLPSLRRVLISGDRLGAELERVKQGVLVQMPRSEFEAKWERASRAVAAQQSPPRLVEARYGAVLSDTSLQGTGQWRVRSPGSVPGILGLQPLNLALEKARLGNGEAILGDLDGKSPGLLVEQAGEQTAFFDWSLRGIPSPDGIRFDVRVPACALATLELRLPADRAIVARDTFLLSGPHPAESADLRRWQLDFAGQSQVDLLIRRTTRSDPAPPLILAQVVSRQEIEADVIRADYDFDLECSHHGVLQFQFECDPGLHPYDVSVRNAAATLESWGVRSEAPGQPTQFTVRLREPFQDSSLSLKLQVRCWAPVTDRLYTCPEVRPIGALVRSERLALRLQPDIRLDEWQAGTFAFTTEADMPGIPSGTKPRPTDGWQVHYLINQGKPQPNSPRSRPRARVVLPTPQYRARQLAWWQINTRSTSLTSWITYEVERGPLFRLPLSLPLGWNVTRVETDPIDLQRSWTVFREEARNTLNVDLSRPLAPAAGKPSAVARLRVELAPEVPWFMPLAGRTVPVPDLAPRGADTREGGLAISFGPLLEGRAQVSAPAVPAAEKGPWGRQTPDSYHAYRGMPVVGSVFLRPHRTQFRARVANDVSLTPDGAVLESRIHLQPGVGSPNAIDLHVADDRADAWEWHVVRGGNSLKSVHRQPAIDAASYWRALGAVNPLDAMLRLGTPVPQAQVWRLTFAQPLREPVRLLGRCKVAVTTAAPDQMSWFAALPVVLGADAMEGEAMVHARDVAITNVVASGMAEEGVAEARGAATWRTFRYHGVPAALRVTGHRRPSDREAGIVHPAIPRASLIATCDPSGKLRIHYAFLLQHWPQRLVPLRLPESAQILGVRAAGRWVADFEVSSTTENGQVVNMPVPAGVGPHPLELVYEMTESAWKAWTEVEAVAPEPPVEPLALRRIWRLPAGTIPMKPERFMRLPGSADKAHPLAGVLPLSMPRPPLPVAHEIAALAPGLEAFVPRSPHEWKGQQRVQMEDVASALAAEARRRSRWTLGESVDYAMRGTQPEPMMLVIDAAALRSEGLAPETPLSLPNGQRPNGTATFRSWDQLGVVYVPTEAVPLLSTPRQVQAWEASGAVPGDIEHAVREAAQHGHDRSGRFRSAAEWVTTGVVSPASRPFLVAPGLADASEGWSDWEPIATSSPTANIVLVREKVVAGAGLTLSLLLVVLSWRGQRWPRRRRALLLFAWLALAGFALWWLPAGLRAIAWYPTLCGAAVAVFAYLRSVSRRQRLTPSVGASTAVVVLALLFHRAYAQAPAGFTVLLVPAADEADQTVLVPPNLVQLLDRAANRGVASLRTPVLIAAKYEATVAAGGTADFRAEYRLYCFGDESAPVTLPLGNLGSNDPVQLKEAMVDGTTAFPEAARPPREGYLLKDIKGKGVHIAVLRFSVSTGSGEERSVRLSIPDVVQSRLTLETPAGSRHLYASTGRGTQKVTPELAATAPADRPLKLECDLGRSPVLHVRWREEGREPRPARLTAKEAYLWNLHPTSSSLFAVYQFTVRQGVATGIDLDVPESLDVRNIAVGRLPAHGASEALPRLRDWTLQPGNPGRLRLHFYRPVARGVQVSLEFVPKQLPGPQAPLPIPAPREVSEAGGFLAFHTEGLDAQVAEHVRVNGPSSADFKRAWDENGMQDPGTVHAYSFQRKGGPPILRLSLSAPASGVECRQRVSWHVLHASQADLAVVAHFRASGRPLSLIEWDVPESVKDVDVSGADVRAWSRTGSRLQVWLTRPCAQTDVRLSGWQGLPAVKGPKLPAGAVSRLQLGSILPLGAATTTYMYVSADPGIALAPEVTRNLARLPTLRRSEQDLGFVATQPDFHADIIVIDRPVQAEAHVLTFGELREREFTFVATVDIEPPSGEARTVTLRVLRTGDAALHLEAPANVGRHPLPRARDRQGWTLTVPPGAATPYRIRVTGRLPLRLGSGVLMPDVRVEGLARVERSVAFAGRELRAEDAANLVALTDVSDRLKRWPGELDRIRRTGTAWQVRGDDWRLRLLPRTLTHAMNASQIMLGDHSAAVVDGRRWMHRATFWLYHESDSDLRIDLPEGARLKSLSVDETEVVLATPANPVWVPRSRLSGARALRLAWVFDAEPIEHPNLTPPRLADVADGPAQWTVHVPVGFERVHVHASEETARRADLDLDRARALLRLSELIVEHDRNNPAGSGTLAAVQELFYRYARKAELGEVGSDALAELYDQNKRLADAHGFDMVRRQAERQASTTAPSWTTTETPRSETGLAPDAFPPAERGTPLYFRTSEPPSVTLIAASAQAAGWGTRMLAIYLCLIALAGVLGNWPRLAHVTRLFWPEQMLGLGVIGWALVGGNWIFAFLILLGVFGRLVQVAAWLGSLRPRAIPPGPGSTVIKPSNVLG